MAEEAQLSPESISSQLDRAIADPETLESLPLVMIGSILDAAIERPYLDAQKIPEAALTAVVNTCHLLIEQRRKWTVFTDCLGNGTWWVRGGETAAIERFTEWMGFDPFETCESCGDSNWSVVDVPLDAEPHDDAVVVY